MGVDEEAASAERGTSTADHQPSPSSQSSKPVNKSPGICLFGVNFLSPTNMPRQGSTTQAVPAQKTTEDQKQVNKFIRDCFLMALPTNSLACPPVSPPTSAPFLFPQLSNSVELTRVGQDELEVSAEVSGTLTTKFSLSQPNPINNPRPGIHLFGVFLSPTNINMHHVSTVPTQNRSTQDQKQAKSGGSDYFLASPASSPTKKRETVTAEDNARASKKQRQVTVSPGPGEFEKELTASDLGHLSRLMLTKSYVTNQILPFLSSDTIDRVNNGGLEVEVFDQETESTHRLTLKLWHSSNSYVLCGNWVKEFVKRRSLELRDKVLLCWDGRNSRFHFRVLSRA